MSLWKNPAPDAAQPMVNTSEILTVSSAYTNHCITCAEATTRAEAAEARVKVLEEALRACRRAISHGAEEPRRNVREIADEALGGEHE